MARGLDAGKYFWRSGREKCFSLDIPFYRTSPFIGLLARNNGATSGLPGHPTTVSDWQA
jgi:hypothetical protein